MLQSDWVRCDNASDRITLRSGTFPPARVGDHVFGLSRSRFSASQVLGIFPHNRSDPS